ncbi:MAG: hypothetical protein OES25_06165 [Acidobacteriota bacterium]|nr:hypothetical protein [Acidobacteriota bacterium]
MKQAMILAVCLTLGGIAALAAPPELLSTQGKLLDSGGVPVADGNYEMAFRFYDDCVAGQLLLEDYHAAVSVADGIYSVLLGSGVITPGVEANLTSTFANRDTVCLGLTVNTDSEMTPRTQLVSTGYALRAATADFGPGGGTLLEASGDIVWTGSQTFETGITMGELSDLIWPHITGTVVPDAQFRIIKYEGDPIGQNLHPNQELDEQWMICYNCTDEGVFQRDPTQHAWNQKIEATYWDGVRESLEYNWNYTNPFGNRWRPFAFQLFIDGTCSDTMATCTDDAECNPGATCDGSNRASFIWNTRPDNGKPDVEIRHGSGKLFYRVGLIGNTVYDGSNLNSLVNEVEHDIELLPGTTAGTATGLQVANDLDGTEANVSLTDVFANRALNYFIGTIPDRSVTGKMIAFDARNEISQTGTGSAVGELYGFRYKLVPTGQFTSVDASVGVLIDSPTALAGSSPVTFDGHVGLLIGDQQGLGQSDGAALRIDDQNDNPSPDRGNLELAGGNWNNGHLLLGNMHLWADSAAQQVRVNGSSPTSAADGQPIHAPRGTTPNWGGVFWSDGTDSALNTGDEVCAAAGMTCKEVYTMGSAVSDTCSTNQNNTVFMAFCY